MTVYQEEAARMENSVWQKDFASVSSDSYAIVYSSVNLCVRKSCEICPTFAFVECANDNSQQGDGTSRGTCDTDQVCLPNGECVGMFQTNLMYPYISQSLNYIGTPVVLILLRLI